jgi:hypothetical protein
MRLRIRERYFSNWCRSLSLRFLILWAWSSVASFSEGLSINPVRVEISVPAGGAVYEGHIQLRQKGSNEMPLSVDFIDETPLANSSWFSAASSTLALPPAQEVTLPYRIEVPAGVAGELRGRLAFSQAASSTATGGMEIVSRISVMIYVVVQGTERWAAEIESIRIPYSPQGWRAEVVVHNQGNVHIRPKGELRILDSEGHKTLYTIPVNEGEYPILPQSSFALSTKPSLWKPESGSYLFEAILRFADHEIIRRQAVTIP